jgi:hypothetical protein
MLGKGPSLTNMLLPLLPQMMTICSCTTIDRSTTPSSMQRLLDRSGVSMGPISLSFDSDSVADEYLTDKELIEMVRQERKTYKSIHSMTTEEWRAKFEKDGAIDLWVEEEFNAGSRLVVCNHRSQ